VLELAANLPISSVVKISARAERSPKATFWAVCSSFRMGVIIVL
jgi:hypothetical protein